jgi:predicted nuclease of predicted toxin-antitoxin system
MTLWIDAQLSPAIALWLRQQLGIEAVAARDLGLREATDREIFLAARQAAAVVLTKDRDFVQLVNVHGPPPQVLWLTCGNTSNARLREILTKTLTSALAMLAAGEKLVEIRDIDSGESRQFR